jgi:hypothetical protein
MKGIKLLLVLFLGAWNLHLSAQSLLPPLRDNATAQIYVGREIQNLEIIIKYNPTWDLEKKLYLYQQTLGFLQAPTTVVKTTEQAMIEAFTITEMKWSDLPEAAAQEKYYNQQWSPQFVDLVILLKV